MSEQNNDQIAEPDRYTVQYIELSTEAEGSSSRVLQDALNEGSRKSQRLIGVAQDPVGKGILLFWDLEGFISG